jgi:hypothetical protein
VGYGCTTTSACHQVNILTRPTVDITVDNNTICEGGVITATAYATPTPTPENPYNYVWKINGVQLAGNSSTIQISSNFLLGVNEITVDIVLAHGSFSCDGTNTYLVNVLGAPSLDLTQDIEGVTLPGMCVGGTVNLHAQIVDFDATLVNVNNFTYQWKRNGGSIAGAFDKDYSQMLSDVGVYNYDVRAIYPNTSLSCNTDWASFEPVKVVAHPTVTIAPKDYNYYDVCQYATIEVISTLNITDANIHLGYQYRWNDIFGWDNFTTQIPPRQITFPVPGQYSYNLEVEFANPTCKPNKLSNVLTYNVISNPEWTHLNINPKNDACVGEEVVLEAEFVGGVGGVNIGRIQWQYKVDAGLWTNVLGVGGYKIHVPEMVGAYTYRATYEASNALTGCFIDPYEINIEIHTATHAWFANTDLPPHTCANDPYANPVILLIAFEGSAPYDCYVKGTDGTEYRFTTSLNP